MISLSFALLLRFQLLIVYCYYDLLIHCVVIVWWHTIPLPKAATHCFAKGGLHIVRSPIGQLHNLLIAYCDFYCELLMNMKMKTIMKTIMIVKSFWGLFEKGVFLSMFEHLGFTTWALLLKDILLILCGIY